MSSLLPEDLHSQLILSSLQLVLCRVAVVKRLPIRHHGADYIFWSFWVIGIILSQSETKALLKPVLEGRGQCCTITLLHMNRPNTTESAFFVFLMCSLFPENLHSELILPCPK